MKLCVISLYVISLWIISGCNVLKIDGPKNPSETHFIHLINFIPYSTEESFYESLLINRFAKEECQQLQIESNVAGVFYHYQEDSLPIHDFHELPFVYAFPSHSATLPNKLFIKYAINELIVIDTIAGPRKYHYSRLKAINSSKENSIHSVVHNNSFLKNKKLKGALFSTFFWDENNLLSRVKTSDFVHLSLLTAELKPIHLFLEKNQNNEITEHLVTESYLKETDVSHWDFDSLRLKIGEIELNIKLPKQETSRSFGQSNFTFNGIRGIIHRL